MNKNYVALAGLSILIAIAACTPSPQEQGLASAQVISDICILAKNASSCPDWQLAKIDYDVCFNELTIPEKCTPSNIQAAIAYWKCLGEGCNEDSCSSEKTMVSSIPDRDCQIVQSVIDAGKP